MNESTQVISLIIQYLRENHLYASVDTLVRESGVILNTISIDRDELHEYIINQQWDHVLSIVQTLHLPDDLNCALYEHIILDLLHLREIHTANAVLLSVPEEQRALLAPLLSMSCDVLPHKSREQRQSLADAVTSLVVSPNPPPSRLLTLLTDALKWQAHIGHHDVPLFSLKHSKKKNEEEVVEDVIVKRPRSVIKFGTQSYAQSVVFSPNGEFLVSGSVDGYVEVWNPTSGKLNRDLKFQADDDIMMHDSAILSLAFSDDSELLASATNAGEIKVWRVRTGECVRTFDKAHSMGVTAMVFARNGHHLVSGSYDQSVRVHGLKSGRTLKEFRAHTAFINDLHMSSDGKHVYSASSDGSVRLWDMRTGDSKCVASATTDEQHFILDENGEFIGTRNGVVRYDYRNNNREIVRRYEPQPRGSLVMGACLSPHRRYLYMVTDANLLLCFKVSTGAVEHYELAHDTGVTGIGVAHHPRQSVVVTYATDSQIKIWT